MFFLITFLISYKSPLIDELRNGKTFHELVDTSVSQEDFNSTEQFFEIMHEIEFPSQSCYIEIIKNIRYDCEQANETQQKHLAIQFTQCFYNITGKLDEFPCDAEDSEKTSKMSNFAYSIFMIMKVHWKNLCLFSKRNVFNEETSKSLIDLYQSMKDSIESISTIKKEIVNISISFNKTIAQIQTQLDNTSKLLQNMQNFVNDFGNSFEGINTFLETAVSFIRKVKLFLTMAIFAFIVAMFLPNLLAPIISLTIFVLFVDKVIENFWTKWSNSLIRIILKNVYFIVCFIFPIYKIIKLFFGKKIIKKN